MDRQPAVPGDGTRLPTEDIKAPHSDGTSRTAKSIRHSSRKAKFDDVFGFSPDAYMQDWEIELADGQRLAEFIDAYYTLARDDDERFALMGLIVASSHDALDFYGLTSSQWQRVHDRLVADANLHASTIYFWCCTNATCDDKCFTLTSRMRRVWNDVEQQRCQE